MNSTEQTPEAPAQQSAPPAYVPPVAAASDPRRKSPALACMLSCMPGLGQVYVGYYQRGFLHAIVVASLIALLGSGRLDGLLPLAALFLAFFWLYNIIDAGRRATLYNQVLAGGGDIDMPRDFEMPGLGGSMFGGITLLVVGFILLLNTRFAVSLDWLEEWWPLVLMGFGAYLLYKAMREKAARSVGAFDE